ncbi:MAG TPA: hypothetical protein VGH54_21320 [Mycobacterium sp.]|jgi:hypothetical protein|uniref:hypothetical protein n=1 Tax=Mycobacterium sp. TaxID=1785 RepID=UPI002F3F8D39
MSSEATVGIGERIQFDGKRTSWLARAATDDGRYTLLTASLFGKVYYTIIDWQRGMRGPMNVIGWGLGIFTTSGPDEAIDKAMLMLRPWQFDENGHGIDADEPRGFELSHRGEVRLDITNRAAVVGGEQHGE